LFFIPYKLWSIEENIKSGEDYKVLLLFDMQNVNILILKFSQLRNQLKILEQKINR